MVKWYGQLYIDNVIKKKKTRIMKKIEQGKITFDVYCIAFSSNEKNLFDIINTNELLFSYYKEQDICILGLAAGRESAVLIVAAMIEEIYRNTGEFKVREYYKFGQQTDGW